MNSLDLDGEVGGETWRRLGREAARGRLGSVTTGREVVRRGRSEDLGAVWGSTESYWDGMGMRRSSIKVLGRRAARRRIEEMIL